MVHDQRSVLHPETEQESSDSRLPPRSQPLTPINQASSRLSSQPDLKYNFAFGAVSLRTWQSHRACSPLDKWPRDPDTPLKNLPPSFPVLFKELSQQAAPPDKEISCYMEPNVKWLLYCKILQVQFVSEPPKIKAIKEK